ncbi:nucleoporin GLE1 [Metschnikowia aff. pulcherrima]|uniref:mRNA export factor GLE1 n=1 Tax=Metschnikowia aff. pulcherrima TaxID=2163413 RepID=A0A4P6XRR8_9ASCO|nr:nucleoporin GLE1 [Metschnikowia aff. pulcherrima]
MRFGLPTSHGMAILPEQAFFSPGSEAQVSSSKSPTSYTHQSASQILEESLKQLDSLYILKSNSATKHKSEKWKSYLARSIMTVNANISHIEEEFNRNIRELEAEVQKIIEEQVQLREKEKQRLFALEQERQRREKEELERRIRAQEEEKKRLEEKRKLEEQKIAEQKKREEDQRIKKEKEDREREEMEMKLKAQKDAAVKKASAFANSKEIERTLLKYRQDIVDIKTHIVNELDKDKELKKSVGVIKRKVNVKLGQLSSSIAQLNIVTNEIINLIQPLTSQPLAYKWLLNFVLKAIVAQAESEVIVKPTAALPLGRLAYNLLCNLDGLEYYLSARFVKKCCLVIGYTGTIDTEEGRIRMGWRRSDGKWESEVKYEERIGGILSVWAVITWANTTDELALFDMKAEWRFLARLLNTNMDLIADVHFVAVCSWWEAAARNFCQVYGKQGQKLISLVIHEWVPHGKEKGYPAATRLQILGEDLFTRRDFNSLKEMDR